jgi:hypothetical protein
MMQQRTTTLIVNAHGAAGTSVQQSHMGGTAAVALQKSIDGNNWCGHKQSS